MSPYSPYLSYISLYLPVGAAGDLAAKKTFPSLFKLYLG
jgi:glucose-6-phosphate 1-dehydrogenase